MTDHDEPNCDPTVDCKFVGPRDCPCRCHNAPLTAEELAEIKRNTTMWIPIGRDRTLRLIAEVERLRAVILSDISGEIELEDA